jgi:hypothetical protein
MTYAAEFARGRTVDFAFDGPAAAEIANDIVRNGNDGGQRRGTKFE